MTLLDGDRMAGQDLLGRLDRRGRASPIRSCRPSTGETARRRWGWRPPADVHKAAAGAAEAQRDWAAAPYNERAAVLRRAGDLWHANAEEITGWLMRETGAIGPFGGFQIMTSAEECYEAAALASAPYGELLRSAEPAAEHGAPAAGRGGRRHRAVQRADHPLHPRGRAGAGAGQRRAPQARPAHRGQRRRRASPQIFAAGRPARRACCTCCPAAPTSARPWSPSPLVRVDRVHRLHPGRPRGRRRWRRSTSSGCTSSSAATRRCSCSTTSTSTRRRRSAPGARSPTRARSA